MVAKTRREQRKSRKQRKKKEEKRKATQRQTVVPKTIGKSAIGFLDQIAKRTPRAWAGELPEDVAVFDDKVRKSLSQALVAQVEAIRAALQLAAELQGDAAMERLKSIPRSSPLSEWRLYIRGLVAWLASEFEQANESWKRLDSARRPGRIAIAMMAARRGDLDAVATSETDHETAAAPEAAASEAKTPDEQWSDRLDSALLRHAKVLRGLRFDRVAIALARASLGKSKPAPDVTLTPADLDWLKDFRGLFAKVEPRLVEQLGGTALRLAAAQPYLDMFTDAIATFRGPAHDPRNLLLQFRYHSNFEPTADVTRRMEAAMTEYVTRDLPDNQNVSKPLRGALLSKLHLEHATELIEALSSPRARYLRGNEVSLTSDKAQHIKGHLTAALRDYPSHLAAYRTYADWLEFVLEEGPSTKAKQAPVVEELASLMTQWTEGLPNDPTPHLWLLDHFLTAGKIEEAKPHVEWLATARQDNPHVRSAPWKWQLLATFDLARRKSTLAQLPEALAECETLWPKWLSKQWLPYLQAAAALRRGDREGYQRQRDEIGQKLNADKDTLADACLMLAAGQRMSLPSADLKPIREAVDKQITRIQQLSLAELIAAGSFFWDLQRTKLLYPAYRKHGSKLAREFQNRIFKPKSNDAKFAKLVTNEETQAALLWCSEHAFFNEAKEFKHIFWDDCIERPDSSRAVLAIVNGMIKQRKLVGYPEYDELSEALRKAVQTERDPFYRYFMNEVVDKFDERRAKSPLLDPFDDIFTVFGSMMDEYDDEFDDVMCDCDDCRRARGEI